MACRGCLECILKLLNFVLGLCGLAMVGYGIYLIVKLKQLSSSTVSALPDIDKFELLELGRPMILTVALATSIIDKLENAWFIYLFIAVGAILFIISLFGCIGATTKNFCCLTCYSVLVILLILAELACAAFIFFDHNWKDDIPVDKTGDFDSIYEFLKKNWKYAKWVALGAVLLQALAFLLSLVIKAANTPAEYDSDDEYIAPRLAVRQPLLSRQGVPVAGIPVMGAHDSRPSRNDAWSTRMREKYGLDTAEFTYDPSDTNRYQPPPMQASEERKWCTIL